MYLKPPVRVEDLESTLLSLLRGKHSSLTISYNDDFAPNYMTLEEYLEAYGDEDHPDDWVSPEEREKAIKLNKCWDIQWYPSSPGGFIKVRASSLSVLLAHVEEKFCA